MDQSDDSPDAFQRLKVEILLPVARGEEEMSIAKWLVPLSCTSRGEVANARPRRTKGPTPDVWTPWGVLGRSGPDPWYPPWGVLGSGSRPDFDLKMTVRTGILRRNAALTSF